MVKVAGPGFLGIVPGLTQAVQDLSLVGEAESFQRHRQLHAGLTVNVDKLVVVQLDNIAVFAGYQLGHPAAAHRAGRAAGRRR